MERRLKVQGICNEEEDRILIMTFGDGMRGNLTYCTILDSHGDLLDYIRLNLSTTHTSQDKDKEEEEALKEFIEKHEPSTIVVGGFKVNTKTVLKKLADGLGKARVVMVEDEVARVVMKRSGGEWPELLKYSVSLGRGVQDVVAETATLCTESL